MMNNTGIWRASTSYCKNGVQFPVYPHGTPLEIALSRYMGISHQADLLAYRTQSALCGRLAATPDRLLVVPVSLEASLVADLA